MEYLPPDTADFVMRMMWVSEQSRKYQKKADAFHALECTVPVGGKEVYILPMAGAPKPFCGEIFMYCGGGTVALFRVKEKTLNSKTNLMATQFREGSEGRVIQKANRRFYIGAAIAYFLITLFWVLPSKNEVHALYLKASTGMHVLGFFLIIASFVGLFFGNRFDKPAGFILFTLVLFALGLGALGGFDY